MQGDLTYFIHEDDWAMIEFLPVENRAQVETTMRTDDTHGNLHLDKRPVVKCPIAMHGLSLDTLDNAFGRTLVHTDDLLSGRTTHMQHVNNGFAFYNDHIGAIYGTHHDGMVCSLYFDNRLCDCDYNFASLIKGLSKLGKKYNLFLADWWLDVMIELKDKSRVQAYIEEE